MSESIYHVGIRRFIEFKKLRSGSVAIEPIVVCRDRAPSEIRRRHSRHIMPVIGTHCARTQASTGPRTYVLQCFRLRPPYIKIRLREWRYQLCPYVVVCSLFPHRSRVPMYTDVQLHIHTSTVQQCSNISARENRQRRSLEQTDLLRCDLTDWQRRRRLI